MGKKAIGLLALLVLVGMVVWGCGQVQQATETVMTATTTTTTTTSTTITAPESGGTGIAKLFNVSGAKAIASASISSKAGSSSIRAMDASANDILKLTASGELLSILSLESYSRPTVAVIETGPDGSLYIGFQWGISFYDKGSFKQLAFFRIWSNGTVEVVDDSILGMGSLSYDSSFGELPVKQVQFDSEGNIYYLGIASIGGIQTVVLRKKTVDGEITRIGNSSMSIRDFVVCPNGLVLFHGSNANDWEIEWLRVINQSNAVYNLFYNDRNITGYGYLRSYFLDKDNNIILVGNNMAIQTERDGEKKYSGVIHVFLDLSGRPTSAEALYDDYNMYGDTNIGNQLIYGYWDGSEYKKFFVTNNNGNVTVPLSLEAGVTEGLIRDYIRGRFKSNSSDTLDGITFEGMSTSESGSWQLANWLNGIVNLNISGESWVQWRNENGLQGVAFGNAKQLLRGNDGALYAVMKLDSWGSSLVKGDRFYRLLNSDGEPDMIAYLQDSVYKYMKRSRIYGEYLIYLSAKSGNYKILRLFLKDPPTAPVDMTSDRSNVEMYSFNFNPVTNMLMYDVYDLSNSTTYLVEQEIASTSVASQNRAAGYTITDIVPFEAVK